MQDVARIASIVHGVYLHPQFSARAFRALRGALSLCLLHLLFEEEGCCSRDIVSPAGNIHARSCFTCSEGPSSPAEAGDSVRLMKKSLALVAVVVAVSVGGDSNGFVETYAHYRRASATRKKRAPGLRTPFSRPWSRTDDTTTFNGQRRLRSLVRRTDNTPNVKVCNPQF